MPTFKEYFKFNELCDGYRQNMLFSSTNLHKVEKSLIL